MPKFVEDDKIMQGDQKITGVPVYQDAGINADGDRVLLVYDTVLFQADPDIKENITIATDGSDFNALAAADTVSVVGKYIVIDFDSALSTATNKIKVAKESVVSVSGDFNAEVTTDAIDAS